MFVRIVVKISVVGVIGIYIIRIRVSGIFVDIWWLLYINVDYNYVILLYERELKY